MVSHALGGPAARPSFLFPLPVNASVPPLRTERQALELMVHALPTYRVKRRRILVEASQLVAERDDKRFVALCKWAAILELNPPASQVGRSVLQVQTEADAGGEGAYIAV